MLRNLKLTIVLQLFATKIAGEQLGLNRFHLKAPTFSQKNNKKCATRSSKQLLKMILTINRSFNFVAMVISPAFSLHYLATQNKPIT